MMTSFYRFEQVDCGQLLLFDFYSGIYFPGSTKLNSALYKGPNVNLDFIPVAVQKLPVQRYDYSSVVHFIFCHSTLQNGGCTQCEE